MVPTNGAKSQATFRGLLELLSTALPSAKVPLGPQTCLKIWVYGRSSSGQSAPGPRTPPALSPQQVNPCSPTTIRSTFTTSTSPRLTPSTNTGPPTGFSSGGVLFGLGQTPQGIVMIHPFAASLLSMTNDSPNWTVSAGGPWNRARRKPRGHVSLSEGSCPLSLAWICRHPSTVRRRPPGRYSGPG